MDKLIEEISKRRPLTEDQKTALVSEIEKIQQAIARQRKWVLQTPDHHMRKSALNSMIKCLATLREHVAQNKNTLEVVLRETVLPMLGMYLTYTGMAEITDGKISTSRRIEVDRLGADDRIGGGVVSVGALDQYTANERAGIAQSIGTDLLTSLVRRLETPLRETLKIEMAGRGGRPQDIERNYVIQELGHAHSRIFGKRPTTTVGGFFELLCADALTCLAIKAGDLKSAIPGVLERSGQKRRAAKSHTRK